MTTTNKQSAPPVGPEDMHGYTVAYEREELHFPVYVVAFIGVCILVAGVAYDNTLVVAFALLALGYAYHNFPLLEVGKPRIGASQYGVFADGLGIIGWRAVKAIDLISLDMRGAPSHELHITLSAPLDKALIADWRERPFYRFLMRLPWTMMGKDVIRIPLDVFDHAADEIYRNFARMMKFYGSAVR